MLCSADVGTASKVGQYPSCVEVEGLSTFVCIQDVFEVSLRIEDVPPQEGMRFYTRQSMHSAIKHKEGHSAAYTDQAQGLVVSIARAASVK